MKKAAIIMGSKSDFGVVLPAYEILKEFGVETEMRIMSAHRSPEAVSAFAEGARENGFGVIIACAGKSAHLAGVIAGHTVLPVIGLPIKSSLMDGMDSLLSIVQMPSGIPVATVGINGGQNAGLLAVQILASGEESLFEKLSQYKKKMAEEVALADEELQKEYKK